MKNFNAIGIQVSKVAVAIPDLGGQTLQFLWKDIGSREDIPKVVYTGVAKLSDLAVLQLALTLNYRTTPDVYKCETVMADLIESMKVDHEVDSVQDLMKNLNTLLARNTVEETIFPNTCFKATFDQVVISALLYCCAKLTEVLTACHTKYQKRIDQAKIYNLIEAKREHLMDEVYKKLGKNEAEYNSLESEIDDLTDMSNQDVEDYYERKKLLEEGRETSAFVQRVYQSADKVFHKFGEEESSRCPYP